MAQTFIIRANGNLDTLLAKVKKLASGNSTRFSGNSKSGSFAALGVEASYKVVNRLVHITITKKPFIYPWSLVESKIRGFFA